MDTDYEDILNRHEANIDRLLSKYETSIEKNRILEKDIENKQNEILAYKEKLDEIIKKHENLKLAHALVSSEDSESKEAKLRLNKIIREIDNCIALLNT
jgi:hypothetical protein